MSKRAVSYARVSYDDRDTDGRNLAGQLAMCREYAQSQGWLVVAELAEDDRGASGADWDLPQLTKALAMARAGEFDMLVVRELDRFARGLAKQLVTEGEFKRAGVEIAYVLGEYADTPEGGLMKNFRAVIGEYERLKINERTVRGRQLKVQAGNVLVSGNPPYGYLLAEKDGKTMLEICESEARIVRLIFQWYTEGDGEREPMSIEAIAKRLTEMRAPTFNDARGKKDRGEGTRQYGEWKRLSVLRALRNETYGGRWHYGKCRGREHIRNPESNMLEVEVPAIVTHEVWEAAQEQVAYNQRYYRREPKYEYLLSKRVTCSACGSKMSGRGCRQTNGSVYRYYSCPAVGTRDYAHSCDVPLFRADQVDAAVWDWLKEKMSDPERLAQGLMGYQAEQEAINQPIRARLAVLDSLITDNRKQLVKLLDLYLSGDFPKEMLTERKARLETTISSLEKERSGLSARLEAQTMTDDEIRTVIEFAAKIGKGFDAVTLEERRTLIDSLDVQARLAVEDGVKVVHVECVLPDGRDTCVLKRTTR